MRGKINETLYELYSPLSTTHKLKIAIPIISSLVSYEMETDVSKAVVDKIDKLKNFFLRFKKQVNNILVFIPEEAKKLDIKYIFLYQVTALALLI